MADLYSTRFGLGKGRALLAEKIFEDTSSEISEASSNFFFTDGLISMGPIGVRVESPFPEPAHATKQSICPAAT